MKAQEMPLALPCPAWHTAPDRGPARQETRRWLADLSDEELIEVEGYQDNWQHWYLGMQVNGREPLPSTKPKYDNEEYERSLKIEALILNEMASRFCRAVAKRKEAARLAASTRARKKASARAFDARSNEVSAPFARRAA